MSLTAKAIIDRKGASVIADALDIASQNVRMWKKRNRIPPEHWRDLADKGFATLDELAQTVARAA